MARRAGEAEESGLNRAIRSGVPTPAKFSSYEMLGTRQLLRPYDPLSVSLQLSRSPCFVGERMVLIPPLRQTGEGEEHREITWERIAAE